MLWGPSGRDAKSPVSGGRLPYLDVQCGLPYGRTYLPFSPYTYGMSGGSSVLFILLSNLQFIFVLYAD